MSRGNLQTDVDDALSDLEVEVLRRYVQGRSYVEIDGHLRERSVAERA